MFMASVFRSPKWASLAHETRCVSGLYTLRMDVLEATHNESFSLTHLHVWLRKAHFVLLPTQSALKSFHL